MTDIRYLETPTARLAYARSPGVGPTIVFLSGYKSDMDGTKAVHLQAWARMQGRDYLRLDYSGHGRSSGAFEEGCIGDWAEDAQAAITSAAYSASSGWLIR